MGKSCRSRNVGVGKTAGQRAGGMGAARRWISERVGSGVAGETTKTVPITEAMFQELFVSPKCKYCPGRTVTPGKTRNRNPYDTCCRPCAVAGKEGRSIPDKDHSAECKRRNRMGGGRNINRE